MIIMMSSDILYIKKNLVSIHDIQRTVGDQVVITDILVFIIF